MAPGRPPFEPTDDQRKLVRTLSGYGLKQEDICFHITNPQTGKPITLKTLYEYFRSELDEGIAHANAAVAAACHAQAAGRPKVYDEEGRVIREEVKPVPTMTIWWEKTRMGYREPAPHELEWGIEELERALKDAKARRAQREQLAADAGEHREAGGAEAALGGGKGGRAARRNGQVRPLPN